MTALPQTASADLGNFTFKTGAGEEITYKRGWFGRETKVVKDRIGDKYESKKGLFGGKETNVSLLGNQVKRKKGWFGKDEIEASTILGDSIKSKKGWFGRRETTVDVRGVSSLVKQLVGGAGLSPALAAPVAPQLSSPPSSGLLSPSVMSQSDLPSSGHSSSLEGSPSLKQAGLNSQTE